MFFHAKNLFNILSFTLNLSSESFVLQKLKATEVLNLSVSQSVSGVMCCKMSPAAAAVQDVYWMKN